MPTLELEFHLAGELPIAADHGYHLYGALSRTLPAVHAENGVGVHPIRGRQIGDRRVMLMPWSGLRLRTPDGNIAQLVRLAGQRLDVGGHSLRVGVPEVRPLEPAPGLRSRLVTIKGFLDPDTFREAVRRKLDTLGVSPQAAITIGKRRTLRIKDKEVVGFEVILEALTAEDSLRIQENGDPNDPHTGFGRRHMGCAMFEPFSQGANR